MKGALRAPRFISGPPQQSEHDFGGAGGRRPRADLHDPIEAGKGLHLLPAFRRVADQRRQRCCKTVRRAFLLHDLRHDVLAEHQVGEDIGGHSHQPSDDKGLERRHLVGRDHRHAGEGELERDRAGFCQRRAGHPKCRSLFRLARTRCAAEPAICRWRRSTAHGDGARRGRRSRSGRGARGPSQSRRRTARRAA